MTENLTRRKQMPEKIGYLSLLERIAYMRSGGHRVKWRCRCECGKEVARDQHYLQTTKTPSCGCKHPKWRSASDCPSWTGYEEIPGSYFYRVKKTARLGDKEFSVTIEEMWDLFLAQNRRCALTGLPLQFGRFEDREEEKRTNASLDRIDSYVGYVTGNIQWVHKHVNLIKMELPQEAFIAICRRVTHHTDGGSDADMPVAEAVLMKIKLKRGCFSREKKEGLSKAGPIPLLV